MRTLAYLLLSALSLLYGCGGGGGGSDSGSGGSGGGGGTTPPATGSVVVLAANDLGMHCMDREFSIFSILPPFNVVSVQVIGHDASGKPVVLNETAVDPRYEAAADATGSINSYSIGKTGFWSYANTLFGMNLANGQGLTGLYMPGDDPQNRGAQPIDFNLAKDWFSADGIPITPTDDGNRTNTYPLLEISAHDVQTGQKLAGLKVVVPVATETECRGCHATGKIGATRALPWANDPDTEVQSKKNILLLHDALQSTSLQTSTPVLCAGCHYSKALDLSGSGPAGNQVGKPFFSRVMHSYHGNLPPSGGQPIFPDNISSCYQCHPGQVTQCDRGAMKTGGMDCIDCHNGMLAVGGVNNLQAGGSIDGTNDGSPRRPWTDLPRCQACHTGDAVDHLSGAGLVVDSSGIRLAQAYRTGDASASPLLATNKRFAEENNKLYRQSKGHGGIMCEGCHGSTHAVWPNADAAANDNVAALTLQGYSGKISECTVCHAQGSLSLTTNGPHGLHNVNDTRWVSERHGSLYQGDKNGCKACHGTDLLGTVLAKVPTARVFTVEDGGRVTFAKDDLVACNHCHSRPGL